MHELFHIVLNRKDLSKAGDLFHLKDSIIVLSLPSVIAKIQEISSSPTYIHNDNDQSVVEICIARITAAVRDSNKIEQITPPLIHLLQSCLSHDLKPKNHHTQPPHAKIASDLLACLFLNYTNRQVMSLTIPVAINFLHKNNTELQRNVSSYISLAAIENSDLLSKHVQIIVDSIISGNYILLRVLPIIYHLVIDKIHENILPLSIILQYCDVNEKNCLLSLFHLISLDSVYPILDSSLQYLMDQLKTPETTPATLKLLHAISQKSKLLPHQLNRFNEINHDSTTIPLTSDVILSIVQSNNGKFSAQALNILIQLLKLNNSTVQNKLLKDFIILVSSYPYLVNQELIKELSFVNSRIFIDKLIELNRNNILNKKSDKGYYGWSMNRLNIPTISGWTPSSKSLTKLNYDRTSSSNKFIDSPLNNRDVESSLNYLAKSSTAICKGLPPPMTIATSPGPCGFANSNLLHHHNDIELPHHNSSSGIKLRSNNGFGSAYHHSSGLTATGPNMNIGSINQISGPSTMTITTNNATNTTTINLTNNSMNVATESNRMSVFEPYPMRDTVQHFCEKHLDKIKSYVEKLSLKIPLPVKCTIEERKSKKNVKLHFACTQRSNYCIYSNGHLYNLKTKYGRIWIHIMFLALQSRSEIALSTREPSVSSLKNCWDILKCENKSFLTLVTSAFPSTKDHENLLLELRQTGYLNVFEFNGVENQWNCFLCNHPEKSLEFLQIQQEPLLQGPLKEKKGKFKIFKRWRTRYFTLSGGMLISENSGSSSTLQLDKIRSVRVTKSSSSSRNIPKAFEIFTDDNSYVLKPTSGKDAETWVQCLSVLVAAANSSNIKANNNGGGSSGGGNSNNCNFVTRTAV